MTNGDRLLSRKGHSLRAVSRQLRVELTPPSVDDQRASQDL
jgi:hypothetical protein